MPRDWFAILGLTPGRYSQAEIDRRFLARRRALIAALDDPQRYEQTRQRLDALHRAYHALRDPERRARCLEALRAAPRDETAADRRARRIAELRDLILASLEGGLLRQSRREMILAEGRRLGLSEFHTHLLIAQVQFDGNIVIAPPSSPERGRFVAPRRVAARFAAVGVVALALFLVMVRWLGA